MNSCGETSREQLLIDEKKLLEELLKNARENIGTIAKKHKIFNPKSTFNDKSIGEKQYSLGIQVQYYNETLENWVVDNDTVNETTPRTINTGSQLALDTIFNGLVQASDLTHGTGTYRIYTAFRDPEGNILRTNDDDDMYLEAWWQFSKT